jgi:hypothetical protein
MVEFLHPLPRQCKQLPGRLSTTQRLCEILRIDVADLEVVALGGERYLAYDLHGFGKRLRVNDRATSLLRKSHPGPLKVYGIAVTYGIQDVL